METKLKLLAQDLTREHPRSPRETLAVYDLEEERI